jgi:uncharacterized RDD family membrane protein YckC
MFTDHNLSGLPDPEFDPQFYDGVPIKRLMAWIVDVVIVSLAVFAVSIFSFGLALFAFFPLIFLMNIGYRWFFIAQNSATLGMHVFGIEIRNGKGEKLSGQEALWHSFFFALLFFFFFIPVLVSAGMMLTNPRGQGLHDYLLGTTAINRPA